MRMYQAGSLAGLALVMAVSLSAAQSPKGSESANGGWFSGLFGESKPKETEKKPEPKTGTTVADRAAALERLEKIYFRRLAVCDRLSNVGVDTDNEALVEEANRLRELAFETWQQQANQLQGVVKSATSEPNTLGGSATQNTARVLRGTSAGVGLVPQRIRDGGRIAPERTAGIREGTR